MFGDDGVQDVLYVVGCGHACSLRHMSVCRGFEFAEWRRHPVHSHALWQSLSRGMPSHRESHDSRPVSEQRDGTISRGSIRSSCSPKSITPMLYNLGSDATCIPRKPCPGELQCHLHPQSQPYMTRLSSDFTRYSASKTTQLRGSKSALLHTLIYVGTEHDGSTGPTSGAI
jgi:hypothetical protein